MASFDDLIEMVDATAKSLLGGELIVTAATLIKVTPGTRMPGALTAGTNPTTTTHACEAYDLSFTSTQLASTLVKASDRMIVILAGTIAGGAIPDVNDQITIGGITYRIVGGTEGLGVQRDSATSRYRCHARA
jgi:hypothetical protein